MSSARIRMRRVRWLGAAVLCTTGTVWAEKVSTSLPVTPTASNNTLTMSVTATVSLGTSSDNDTATVSGNILSDMAVLFDPLTNAASNIHTLELTGGQVAVSDVSMKLSWVFGLASIDLVSKGVGGTPGTPVPPGLVINNSFSAADHQVLLNKGSFVATGKGLAAPLLPVNPYTVDLAAQPIPATSDGTGTITIGAPTLSGDTLSYALKIQMPVAFDQVVYDEPGTATVRATGSGNMVAAGTLTRKLPVNVPTWNVNGGGNWGDGASWKYGTSPNAPGATAWLLDKLTDANSPATITVSGPATVGTLVFENSGRYIIAAGTDGLLKLDNSGNGSVLHTIRGSHVIEAPIQVVDGCVIDVSGGEFRATGGLTLAAGKSLTKRGGGTASIDGGLVSSASSSVNVIEGSLAFESIENGALTIGRNASANIDPNGIATKASLVHSLQITGAADGWLGRLDLHKGRLIVQADSQSPADVLAQLVNQVKFARNAATPWASDGITSSAAEFDASGLTGIGVIANGLGEGAAVYTVFGGQAVNDNSILLKYTWNGDANLDGIVNADDYFQIDSGYVTQIGGWYNGDFNYDGIVNADDYFLIDSAFIGQAGTLSGRIAAVPEPAGLLAAIGAAILLRRRRSA